MGHRVRLVQMFGNDIVAWRAAIAAACVERSWVYHEHWEGEAPPESDADMLIVSPVETEDEAATAWVVMSSSPEQVVDAMCAFGFPLSEARFHASRVLALGSVLAQRGAAVVDGLASTIEIAYLGKVRLDRGDATADVHHRADGLDIYRTLPPRQRVVHELDLGLLSFPVYRETDTGGPNISLMGKRRPLFTTPTIQVCPGRWQATATFAARISTPIRIRFVWGFGTDLIDVEEVISQSGRYQIAMSHDWDAVGPSCLTAVLVGSCLDGELTLETVGLTSEPATS